MVSHPGKKSGSENPDSFSGWQLGKISGATLKRTFQGTDLKAELLGVCGSINVHQA